MTTFSVLSPAIYTHDLEIGQFLNKFSIKAECVANNFTTFGSGGWNVRGGGLKTITSGGEGFADFAVTGEDLALWNSLGAVDQVATTCPNGAETNVAYFWQSGRFAFTPLDAEVGGTANFTSSSQSTNPVGAVRGQLAKLRGNVSATGQLGSILNLGAPSASQFVYVGVHIFTAATTITLQLQSDDNAPFASATTRATIGPLTAAGGTWMTRLAGPFAGETFWRLNVSAITGTFNIGASIGVQ